MCSTSVGASYVHWDRFWSPRNMSVTSSNRETKQRYYVRTWRCIFDIMCGATFRVGQLNLVKSLRSTWDFISTFHRVQSSLLEYRISPWVRLTILESEGRVTVAQQKSISGKQYALHFFRLNLYLVPCQDCEFVRLVISAVSRCQIISTHDSPK